MKKSIYTLSIIFAIGFSLLACSLLPLPSTTVNVSPTFTSLPEIRSEDTTTPQLENENLLVEIPTGFKVGYQARQNNIVTNEMVPSNESVNDWTTLVTVQIFLDKIDTTPKQYQESLTQSWLDACKDSTSYPVADGEENGYSFVLWQLYCPLNASTQKVEYAFLKAIQGNDSFYLVQVAFRHEPSDEEITQWMQYFKQVQVCDSRIPERACP